MVEKEPSHVEIRSPCRISRRLSSRGPFSGGGDACGFSNGVGDAMPWLLSCLILLKLCTETQPFSATKPHHPSLPNKRAGELSIQNLPLSLQRGGRG